MLATLGACGYRAYSGNFPRVAHRCQPSRPEWVLDARPSLTSRLLRAGAFQPRRDEAKGKTMPQRVTITGGLFHPQVPDGAIDVTRQSRSPVGRRFANHGRPSKLKCAGHWQPRPQGPMSIHGHYGGHGRVDLASGACAPFEGDLALSYCWGASSGAVEERFVGRLCATCRQVGEGVAPPGRGAVGRRGGPGRSRPGPPWSADLMGR
jgi:hypothetical protein